MAEILEDNVWGCPNCEEDFTSELPPTQCPLCGYVPDIEDGRKGGFAIGGFGDA